MTIRRSVPWLSILVVALALLWVYPVLWTLTNAVKTTADLYRGPLALPIPPAISNIGDAWSRANLGGALLNSAYVASLTVAGTLVVAVPAAFSLTRLRPPGRAALFLIVLAPLIIPTEVLIVPLFSIYRSLGLINSLPGLALIQIASSVSFATIILTGFFRRIPQDLIDAGRLDGAGRVALLITIAIPLARPSGAGEAQISPPSENEAGSVPPEKPRQAAGIADAIHRRRGQLLPSREPRWRPGAVLRFRRARPPRT